LVAKLTDIKIRVADTLRNILGVLNYKYVVHVRDHSYHMQIRYIDPGSIISSGLNRQESIPLQQKSTLDAIELCCSCPDLAADRY
jgi:hypothetical protein